MPHGASFLEYSSSVSIRAPRFREAMPQCPNFRATATASFNPRPPFPGGDAVLAAVGRRRARFQSAPPVSGRRCHAGDVLQVPVPVSIRAPRFREAMPDGAGRLG